MLTVELQTVDFQPALALGLELQVTMHAWHEWGGPDAAVIEARGDAQRVAETLHWLRRPLIVRNAVGEAVWWGYVYEVAITVGAWQRTVSLREVANRIRVDYRSGGTEQRTAWGEHPDSVNYYGRKERVVQLSTDEMSTAEAVRRRDQELADYALPLTTRLGVTPSEPLAQLTCRGWWSTLGWEYYENTGTASVETTTQIDAICTAAQFVTGVEILDPSGVSGPEGRDGTRTMQEIVEDLLAAGTSTGRRLLATVTPERIVRVYADDPGMVPYRIHGDGRVTNQAGALLSEGRCIAGVWVEDAGLPLGLGQGHLAPVSPFPVARSEWRAGRLWPEGRAIDSMWATLG